MADAVAVDTWEGQGVRLGQVIGALGELRSRSSDRSTTRTAVMTLVIVAEDDEEAEMATSAVHTLGGRHPARIVVLRPDPDRVAALGAKASLYSARPAGEQPASAESGTGHAVNFEEITLHVGGQAALHLDSFVETFTLADLPVVVWYPGSLPEPVDPLLGVAAGVLVDTRDVADPDSLLRLLQLTRRRNVVDLSWIRLGPWRELLAGLFEPPEARRFVPAITSAQVMGKPGPRNLLGGWLVSQLRLRADQVELHDARHTHLTLTGELDGETATFDVGRVTAETTRASSGPADGRVRRLVWAAATIAGEPSPRQVLALPDNALAYSLGEALTHLTPAGVWQRALSAAAALAV